MATFLTNPLPASDAKIRFMEPYVSNGLNRRTVGIIPEGVYRGFDVSAVGTTVTIAADITTMDSVAVCETFDEALAPNQFQLTVRHEGDIVLDFSGLAPADYPNAIVLETVYDLTGTSPLTGVTSVNIKVLDLVDVLPEHVVLAHTTLVGLNVIVDDSFREDTGGPLVTAAALGSYSGKVASSVVTSGPFVFAAGAFAPIPGATVAFTQTTSGKVHVNLNLAQDNFSEFALLIDGVTTVPLTGMVFHTFTGGVGSFVVPVNGSYTTTLAAGPHTIAVMARGGTVLPGTFGFPCTVWAIPALPVVTTVFHT